MIFATSFPRTLLLAALMAASLGAQAGSPLPADIPAFGPEKGVPAPTIHRSTLPNGLQVWVVPRKGPPRVDFVLSTRGAGFTADPADRPAAAKQLASMLNEGTPTMNSQAIAEAAQSYGGAVRAGASRDGLNVVANALPSQAGNMMRLMGELVRNASFPDKEVALDRTNALQTLKAEGAEPEARATRALNQVVFGNHAYSRTQETEDGLNATTAEWLRAEHARRLRPERSLLVIAGRVQPAQALAWARDAFGAWKGQGAAPAEVAPPSTSQPPQRLLLAREGSVQSTLRAGRPGVAVTSQDLIPLSLAGTIVGGSFSSRIMMNLREEKGYTYGAWAGDGSFALGGIVMGGADVRNEVTGASIDEFTKEFRRLGTELVGPEEMAMNKRYVAGTYLMEMQMQATVAQTLAVKWMMGEPPEALSRFVPAIQKVTAEQVRDIARKYYDPAQFSWIVVGDAAQLTDQLKAIGPFQVVPDPSKPTAP